MCLQKRDKSQIWPVFDFWGRYRCSQFNNKYYHPNINALDLKPHWRFNIHTSPKAYLTYPSINRSVIGQYQKALIVIRNYLISWWFLTKMHCNILDDFLKAFASSCNTSFTKCNHLYVHHCLLASLCLFPAFDDGDTLIKTSLHSTSVCHKFHRVPFKTCEGYCPIICITDMCKDLDILYVES